MSDNEHQDLLDRVFNKTGKNILILQEIEGLLKFLLPWLGRNNFQQDTDYLRYERSIASWTLGKLVQEFLSCLDGDVEIVFKSLEIEQLVRDRNRLVHASSDYRGLRELDSKEQCRQRILELDHQRDRSISFYKTLRVNLFSVLECMREFYSDDRPEILSLYDQMRAEIIVNYEYINLRNPYLTGWENTKIVKLLRLAERNTQKIGDMTLLSRAGNFIKMQDPECHPKQYGLKKLVHVLIVSELFYIFEGTEKGDILYKSRVQDDNPILINSKIRRLIVHDS